jgi:hypothetical protein
MTQGLSFLLAMLIEGMAASALGWWLAPRGDVSRASASLRCFAAAVIGTGVTHPAMWLWLSRLADLTGSWWGGVAISQCLVILNETPFYAAALRGHWRLSLALSLGANLASLAGGLVMNWLLVKPA